MEAKALTLGTKWEDLVIDGIPTTEIQEGKHRREWERLRNDFFFTWKFRDLPLDQHHLDTWLMKRRSLATFPSIIKNDTVIQWTDYKGQTRRFHPSRVDLLITEVSSFFGTPSLPPCSRPC